MSDEIEGLGFEDAYRALEAAVLRLEEGELSLEQSIVLFERGMRLARHCAAVLDSAELQVQQLLLSTAQQQPTLFPDDSTPDPDLTP